MFQQKASRFFVLACALLVTGCPKEDEQGVLPDGGAGSACTSNDECASNLVCAGGTCQFEGGLGLGDACWASRDCASGLFCGAQGTCEPAGESTAGEACAINADCEKTLVCDRFGVGGVCAEPGAQDLGQACTQTIECRAGLVCGQTGTCRPLGQAYPAFDGVDCAADLGTFRVFFQVPRSEAPLADFYRLPYPSDIRVRGDGTLDLDDFPRPGPRLMGPGAADIVDIWANALEAEFTGFSGMSAVRLRFSRPFSGDLGPNGAYFHFVDITEGALDYGTDLARRFAYDQERGKYVCQNSLVIRSNLEPLLAGHTYAVYLTTEIRSADGEAPMIEPDFAAVLAPERPLDDEALGQAWDRYAPLRGYLAAQAMDPGTLAAAAVFTVANPVPRAQRLAEQVASTPLPILSDLTLCDTGVSSPCGQEERACGAADPDFHEIHGRFRVPSFLQGVAPYESEGGHILENGSAFEQNGNLEVCFALTIPRQGQGPWPLVVHGHGTDGRFNEIVENGMARTLAAASVPTAVLSFEAVVHGERRGDSKHHPLALLVNVQNPRAARDLRMQAAVDIWQALRIPQTGPLDVPGLGSVALDPARTVYMGHSQGADAGLMASVFTTETQALVLSGLGGYFSQRELDRISPFRLAASLADMVGEELSHNHPFMTLWQNYLDGVDPVTYAPHLYTYGLPGISPKHLFMTWGKDDTFSPSSAAQFMARALRLPVAAPVIQDLGTGTAARPVELNKGTAAGARTAAIFQYEPAGYDGHLVAFRHPLAVSDWVAFVTSMTTSGTPTVP